MTVLRRSAATRVEAVVLAIATVVGLVTGNYLYARSPEGQNCSLLDWIGCSGCQVVPTVSPTRYINIGFNYVLRCQDDPHVLPNCVCNEDENSCWSTGGPVFTFFDNNCTQQSAVQVNLTWYALSCTHVDCPD